MIISNKGDGEVQRHKTCVPTTAEKTYQNDFALRRDHDDVFNVLVEYSWFRDTECC